MPGAWGQPLRELIRAESRDAAYAALACVTYEAVPGGEAAADDAADLVDEILAISNLRRLPHRACLLWVLVLLAEKNGIYAAVHATGRGSITAESLAREARTADRLRAGVGVVQDLVLDADPEVRSMVYRLVGSVAEPSRAFAWLRAAGGREAHPLALACAVEAGAVAIVRQWPDATADMREWLRETLSTGSVLVLGRLRYVLEGYALPLSREKAAEVFGVADDTLPSDAPLWPVETI